MSRKNYYEDKMVSFDDVLELKARLLCLGLKVPKDLLNSVDEYFLEHDFIHGSQILLENDFVVNIPINEKFVFKYSPFELSRMYDEWFITKDGSPIMKCTPLLMPDWVNISLNDSIKIGDIVRPHSNTTLFCTPIKKCVFDKLNKKCKFCTFFENGIISGFNLDLIREAFQTIFSRTSDYKEVAIGGASSSLVDFGVSYYSKVVKIIKRLWPDIRISVEIIPPQNLDLLYDLSSAGVDSVIMNIEIFDDEVRQRICPGKSRVPKSHYFKAWKRSLDIFGGNRVSSILIVGLENKKSTIKGAKKMLGMGVTPTLIPFKPYDACELNYLPPVAPEYYLSVCREIFSDGGEKKVNPLRQPGCTRCGGCSLETILSGVGE